MNRFLIDGVEIQNEIESASMSTSHAMVGESLAADTMTLTLFSDTEADVGTQFKEKSEILYYIDSELVGKFFLQSVARVGANKYKISAVSIIGTLLNSRHYGGIYVGALAKDLFSDVLNGVTYILDPEVANATITGYLPIATRRDNLQQILMAVGATVKIDDEGTVYITSMSPVSTGIFDENRCYIGGSVTTNKATVKVQVTEHNYFEAGSEVVLFNDGLDGTEIIEFNEPYHDLSIEGGTIVEAGANYAKINARGTVTLTGKPYTHVTRIVSAGKNDVEPTDTVKTVSNCYLANPQIAQGLADRLLKFLQCNKTIQQDVLVGTERAGDVVSVINPYTMEMETATIKRFDVTVSGVNRANAEFLVGFVPSGVLSGFTNYATLTGQGSWSVPSGVNKIRIILIGAGGGGSGGKRGTAGEDSSEENGKKGAGGSGGEAGNAGAGGRIFEISLDVTPGQAFDFACGIGGIGGDGQTEKISQSDGTAGTPTTFGGYSSDYGRQYPYGYFEAKTGITFAASGLEGYKGGDGGDGNDQWEDENENRMKGENGGDVAEFSGGVGARARETSTGNGRSGTDYYGGGGGGAAYGAAGGNAGNISDGGDGATGNAGADGVNPGQGGGAGNGGGGGGGAGRRYRWDIDFESYFQAAYGGDPGNGTDGGNGADGAIIIYY